MEAPTTQSKGGMHMTKTINIPKDFSRYPAGRFISDGPFSGEGFRKKFLLPSLKRGESIRIELDGARGYGSSFLEEAFGGLVRAGLDKATVLRLIQFSTEDESLESEIRDYIQQASK